MSAPTSHQIWSALSWLMLEIDHSIAAQRDRAQDCDAALARHSFQSLHDSAVLLAREAERTRMMAQSLADAAKKHIQSREARQQQAAE